MITAIVGSGLTWYCKNCKNNHKILFIDGKKYYCNECLPSDIDKSKIQYMNQNRDILEDFKGE